MEGNLSKNILATLAYCDVFDYPMTAFEIWKHLLGESSEADGETCLIGVSLGDVVRALDTESVRKHVGHSQGLYFLLGREALVKRRLRRGKLAIAKLRGVKRLAAWLRFVPFVRMVALTGSLAMKNSGRKGDWDMLIALRSGHIWTGRALLTVLLHLFGKRRHGEQVTDRACLNYWVTTDSLEMIIKNIFTSHEYSFAMPLVGFQEFRKFQEKNRWIRRFRPHYHVARMANLLCVRDSWAARMVRDVGEVLLSDRLLERILAKIEKSKIESNPKTKWPGSFIVANDAMLIFLPKPKGPAEFEKFERRLSMLY